MSGLSCTYINRLTSDCAERAKARGVVMGRRPKLTPTNGQKPSLVAMLVRPWSPLLEPKERPEKTGFRDVARNHLPFRALAWRRTP